MKKPIQQVEHSIAKRDVAEKGVSTNDLQHAVIWIIFCHDKQRNKKEISLARVLWRHWDHLVAERLKVVHSIYTKKYDSRNITKSVDTWYGWQWQQAHTFPLIGSVQVE